MNDLLDLKAYENLTSEQYASAENNFINTKPHLDTVSFFFLIFIKSCVAKTVHVSSFSA